VAVPLLRAALVLVLLGLAAHGLSGRRRLDWDELTEAPGSPVLLAVLLCLAAWVVVRLVRTLRKLLRATPGTSGEAPYLAGRRLPWQVYLVLGLVLAVGVLVVALLVSTAAHNPTTLRNDAGLDTGPAGPADPGGPPVQGLSLLGAVLAAAAVALMVGLQLARRRAADAGDDPVADEPGTEEDDRSAQALAGAVAAAEVELDAHGDDVRAAIIAAYAAMERELARAGTVRRASDTPTDLLERAVRDGRLSPGPARTLTDLFREARFSHHPMPPGRRDEAARALARVSDDLRGAGV
jgi:hypothetical protein